jgi:putative membrane protein
MLAHLLLSWVLGAALLLLIAALVPGFRISGFGSALIAVLIVALVNSTVGFLLKILLFPITLLTLGLFLLVIDAIVLKLAAAIMPGFSIRGFTPALLGAVLLSLLSILLRFVFGIRPLGA